ncbi:MAG: hypothetical protein Q9160_002641 [Pyrenula sp. 1 TL-2023]
MTSSSPPSPSAPPPSVPRYKPLTHLATLTPSTSTTSSTNTSSSSPRTWQSAPHPTLPLLATASSSKSAHLFSLTSFQPLSTISGGHKRSVRCVAWQPPGGLSTTTPSSGPGGAPCVLATGSFDATVGIWKRDDSLVHDHDETIDEEDAWAFTVLLTGHDSEIKSVAFCPLNPSFLATCSRDKSVWIWEEVSSDDDYETVAVLSEHEGDVKCVAWCPWPAEEGMCLASGGYDDEVRVWREDVEGFGGGEGEWGCVARIRGHGGTVWGIAWEPPPPPSPSPESEHQNGEAVAQTRNRKRRMATCSDDRTVRIWRREIPESEISRTAERGAERLPSIIRPPTATESWVQDTILPRVHFRSVYAIAWSERTGLLASCGGDGSVFVYREIPPSRDAISSSEDRAKGVDGDDTTKRALPPKPNPLNENSDGGGTAWEVVAGLEEAHAEYEINHVCWARRFDRGRRTDDEEVLITTGDDGHVKVWVLPEEILGTGVGR